MGMILRIASSRIVGQGDIVGRSGYFSLNLSANSVMRGRLDARRTLKSLVADLRFPTIFSLSLRHVGTQTKQASSYLIMSIVGGAVAPLLMGLIADRISMAVGFIVPLVCFMEIWGFAARYRKLS